MATESTVTNSTITQVFPEAEARRLLRVELDKTAEIGTVLRPEWEPLLDSLQVVGIITAIGHLFPFRIPPDKVVRKGGYNSVDDALDDIVAEVRNVWGEHNKPRVPK